MVPSPGRECVLAELHGGHPGILRMKSIARMFVGGPDLQSAPYEVNGADNSALTLVVLAVQMIATRSLNSAATEATCIQKWCGL